MPLGQGGTVLDEARRLDDALSAVGHGDSEAFTLIFDALVPHVLGVARGILQDATQAEDVAHEVMLEVWRQAPRFEPRRGSARAWVLQIAHQRTVDRARSAQARPQTEDPSQALDQPIADMATQWCQQHLADASVREAVSRLSPQQRAALYLTVYRGLTYQAAAQSLGVPAGAMRSGIREGLHRLKQLLPDAEAAGR